MQVTCLIGHILLLADNLGALHKTVIVVCSGLKEIGLLVDTSKNRVSCIWTGDCLQQYNPSWPHFLF